MTAPRPRYHHGDARRALLDAAEAALHDGVEGVSLRAVARAVGLDPSAVYRHFEDKGALLTALAGQGFSRLDAALGAVADPDARDRVRGIGIAYVAFALEHPELFRLMFGPWGAGRPGGACGAAMGRLRAAIAALADSGALRIDPEDAAITCFAAVHGCATLLVDGALRMDRAPLDRAAQVVDGVLAGVAPTPSPGRSGAAP